MEKSKYFECLGSMLLINHKDEVIKALENGGKIVLGFAEKGCDAEREETWTLTDGEFLFKDKSFNSLKEFELYMNGDECVSVDVYNSERKVCGMFLA